MAGIVIQAVDAEIAGDVRLNKQRNVNKKHTALYVVL